MPFYLKVVSSQKEEGSRVDSIDRNWYGAGHSFFSGISCRLLICMFPLCIVQFIGHMKKIG